MSGMLKSTLELSYESDLQIGLFQAAKKKISLL